MCLNKDEIERLDDKQKSVNEAAFNQNWIVYGPAGTGKTVLALARLERLVKLAPGEDHVFLSKSKMLGRWIEQAAEQLGVSAHVKSFDQFVWKRVGEYIGSEPPKATPGLSWSEIDWDVAVPLLEESFSKNKNLKKFSVIVDEAQDILPGFFRACRIMCERVFVLMDENQKTEVFANTPRSVVADLLGVDKQHQIYLGINYRNPAEIKNLSEVFYTGDTTELAELAPKGLRRELEAPPAIRWLPFENSAAQTDQVRRIVAYCRDRPKVTVGVVAPNAASVASVHQALSRTAATDPILGSAENWSVRKYSAKAFQPCRTDFCSPGIVVATAVNLKGSEFEAVFLVNWDEASEKSPSMYTLVCRARARIEVFGSPTEASKSVLRSEFSEALKRNLISESL